MAFGRNRNIPKPIYATSLKKTENNSASWPICVNFHIGISVGR